MSKRGYLNCMKKRNAAKLGCYAWIFALLQERAENLHR